MARPLAKMHRLADGRLLTYAEYGDAAGSPVFVLHGTPGSRLNFGMVDGHARDRNLRIIAPDRPGYGGATFKRFTCFSDWAPDLQSLADALDIKGFALIGISGGAPYAVGAAWALPERAQFMGLVSPIGPVADAEAAIKLSYPYRQVFLELPKWPAAMASLFWTMRAVLRFTPGFAFRALMQRVAPSDRIVLARGDVRRALLDGHREGLRRGVRGAVQDLRLFGRPWRIPFRDVIASAVLWQGLEDRNVPPSASEYLADVLPNCRLDVIPDAGHFWVFDHLDEVLDAVEAFLKAGANLKRASFPGRS